MYHCFPHLSCQQMHIIVTRSHVASTDKTLREISNRRHEESVGLAGGFENKYLFSKDSVITSNFQLTTSLVLRKSSS